MRRDLWADLLKKELPGATYDTEERGDEIQDFVGGLNTLAVWGERQRSRGGERDVGEVVRRR